MRLQALALLVILLLLLPSPASAFHVPFHVPAPADLPSSLGPGSSPGNSPACQARREAWVQRCGPISVEWFFVNGRPAGLPVEIPIIPGQLLGDVLNVGNIIGPWDPGKSGHPPWPSFDMVGSFVLWACDPGIQVVQVRIPLRWDLATELLRKRGGRGLAERMTADSLPGFFQWLLTSPAVAICPTSTLDLVRQTRHILLTLTKEGRIEQLADLFQAYLSTVTPRPNNGAGSQQ